jgi:hypothetical protein
MHGSPDWLIQIACSFEALAHLGGMISQLPHKKEGTLHTILNGSIIYRPSMFHKMHKMHMYIISGMK